MALSGKCTFSIRATGETYEIAYSLSTEDIAVLSDFLREVDSLEELPIVRAGIPSTYRVEWKAREGIRLGFSLPPMDDLAALLHRLRPFILTNEPFSFNRVCGILGRRLDSPPIRQLLKQERESFTGKQMQSQVQISSQGILLNCEATLMTWLNSHEYHRDRDKMAELEQLHQVFPLESSKALFVMLLSHKCNAIGGIADLVKCVLGKEKSLQVDLRQLPKPGS
jgi:hypothetical protein